MDELGNWVYIILMVVFAISSLYRSINKKKEEQSTQMPVPELPDFQDFPEQPYTMPPVPMKKSRKSHPPAPTPKNQPYSSLFASSTVSESLHVEKSFMPEQESALADELDLTDAEAFRKAIIYSEILNRKY